MRTAVLVLATVLAACTADPELGASRHEVISDQHHGGVAGFVFLPPVVPPPAAFGDFVPDADPVVVAEQLDPADGETVLRTLATYTRDAAGAARVRVHLQDAAPDDGDDDPAGYFVVGFRAGDLGLIGGDLIRFRVTVGGRELGWADVKVLDRRRDRHLIDRSQYGFVVAGQTLRVKFRIDREALATDPGGGGDGDGDGIPDDEDPCPASPCIEEDPAILSGRVIGLQLGPLPDATVRATGATGSVHTQPDADGVFSLAIPFTHSELRVSRPGFADFAMPLVLGPGTLAEGYEILLEPVLAWYDVTVWRGVGLPQPGASVRVELAGGGGAAGVTDALGEVHFALLPVGVAFTLTVQAPDTGREAVLHVSGLTAGSNTVLVGLYD
jgi:hypothetical protein